MTTYHQRPILPGWLGSPKINMFFWPLIGMGSLLLLSLIYNELLWGEPLTNRWGYLIPGGSGILCGIFCALWHRKSCQLVDKIHLRSSKFEEQSRRYELMFQSTGEGIYEIDSHGKCLFINRAALEMLGYTENELLGQDMHTLTHCCPEKGISFPIGDCPVHNVAKNNKGIRLLNDLKYRKGGSTFIADTFAYPVIDVDGKTANIIVMFRDVTEERKMQKRIYHLATFDSLTGLQNRYSFEQSLKLAIESVGTENRQHTFCYIDIDQFKIINDTAGHIAGDAMLQSFSAYLIKHIRKDDILGRMGGDEFGLLLHDCQLDAAHGTIKNLQNHVARFFFQWEGQSFKVTLSIGICLLDTKVKGMTQALKWADQACYQAKESGRNRYHVYNSEGNEFRTMNEQMGWVARINQALTDKRFFLRQQTIAPLGNKENPLRSFEVLISMQDETGKILPPGGFLPAAERYGMITAIDRWVVQTTFDWLENHPAEQPTLDFISINLSGKSFSDDDLLKFIQTELKKCSFSPAQICFEITETAAMHQMQKSIHFIQEVKKIGCRFALDDFGSGMASFGYLKNFPVDFIKIDGSFVQDMARNPLSRAIVDSIYRVAQVMKIATIAEHAEDQETLETLKTIGIDFVQGYVIARPEVLCLN